MSKDILYRNILTARQEARKQLAVLIDPDKTDDQEVDRLIELAEQAAVDYFLVGSSILIKDRLDNCIAKIKKKCSIPVILFPGNTLQLSDKADGILLLSMISGRNPELLIGQHVLAAPYLRDSSLEVIPTGYMLIDGGVPTSVSYMSNTQPIPANKNDIALCTAMAGEMLGLKMIYMDAGSGAEYRVSTSMIREVSQALKIPLIIGGGIRHPRYAREVLEAGADLVVVGNAIEKNPGLLLEMASAVHESGVITSDFSSNGERDFS